MIGTARVFLFAEVSFDKGFNSGSRFVHQSRLILGLCLVLR